MNKISLMTDDLANKIAAGEVVEKTFNVVKELVENAIDAKANDIKVELIDGGLKEIKVSDNGLGMSRADASLCFKRHASSKILKIDDLFNIKTLGFRGEALPSIAAVSKVTLKTSDGKEGSLIEIKNSEIVKEETIHFDRGTTIIVRDLFYNTPVRLKYLKSEQKELADINDYLSKMALSYPDIKFYLVNNEKELLNTDGSNNLLKVIARVYGIETAKKMIELDTSNEDYKLTGYISYPELTRASRNSINLFVNNRYIRNNELINSIKEAYKTYIPSDKYPIVVLNIELDPRLVDVNIHPTKLDIKFSKMNELKELLISTIEKELLSINLIPEIKTYQEKKIAEEYLVQEEIIIKEEEYDELSLDFEEASMDEPYTIPKIYAVALVHGTYIIGENEEGMFIIDQHAAAERINYERYLKELGKEESPRQIMLLPEKVELSSSDYLLFKEKHQHLEEIGFKFEDFGLNTIMIREHPAWLNENYLRDAILKIIDIIITKEKFVKEKFIDKIAITLACKLSIKANEYLSHEEMQNLLDRLIKTENPYTCPHGRPTIIKYSKYELEKLFKRVMN